MENIAPLLVFVIFIILSLLNRKKPEQGVPQGKPEESQQPQPKPVDLETFFDEFFGEKKKETLLEDEGELVEVENEPVVLREPTAIERAYEEKGNEYRSFQSEPIEENVFQKHIKKAKIGEDYKFSTGTLAASFDSRSSEFFEESDSNDMVGQKDVGDAVPILDDFSPRDAFIYSEIINRKY